MSFKISKAKEYAIIYLNEQGKSVDDIAEELSVAVSSVQSVIDQNPVPNKVLTLKEKSIINRTASNKEEGIAILTQEGSAVGDTIKSGSPPTKDRIFKPLG